MAIRCRQRGVMPLGVCALAIAYVFRAGGLLIAATAPVFPLLDLPIAGWLGWLGNLATNLVAGLLLLVAAERLVSLQDGSAQSVSGETAEE